jgi:hypothetical protein
MKRSALFAAVVTLCITLPAIASAQSQQHSVVWSNTTAFRLNPLGLISSTNMAYRYRLYESDSPALANNFVSFGAEPAISPAWFRGGPFIDIQPASVANFRAGYEYVGYFGTFDQVLSFEDPNAEYDDDTLAELGEAGQNAPTTGTVMYLRALLQAKVGPVAIRNTLRFNRFNVDLPEGDTVYYEQTWDILVPGNGWMFTNDAELLYLTNFGLVAGIRYNVTNAFYDEFPNSDENENGPIHRVGPLISYALMNDPGSSFETLSLFTLINWHVTHRYRAGQLVNQAIPYFAIGVKMTGQIL